MSYSFKNLKVTPGDDGICTVLVDRQKVLNALNDETIGEIEACFHEIDGDPAVRVVILSGAGDRAFVAGADIKELAEQGPLSARTRALSGQRAFDAVARCSKPVIGAVNGFALGGGCELALACHLRYASARAKLGLPEVTLGIIPGYGGTQRLARIVGQGRALEWILTGEMMSADEAYRIGLVNGVFPPEELLDGVREVAGKIASRGPLAIRYALEAVLRGGDSTLSEGLALEAALFGVVSGSRDMKEGLQAFLDKRPAEFQGE